MSSNRKRNKMERPPKKETTKKLNNRTSIEELDLGTKEWEDSIMLPLKIMKIGLIAYFVVALLIPIYKDSGLFIDSFSTLLVMIVMSIGVVERYGKAFDVTPIFSVTFIRVVHFLVNFFFLKHPLNYLFYILLIVIELILSMLILLDKSKYDCVRERKI